MLHRFSALVALTACVLSACGDDSTAPPESTGLRILAGGAGTDTIGTQFTQALVVELRDENGDPVPDHVLRFHTVPVDPSQSFSLYTAYLSPVDRNDQRTFVPDTTDAEGRARVLVRLGLKAGPAIVVVTDPDLGTADTATFTVQPGNAVRVLAAPRDTAIYVGNTATLRSAVVDRAGNPRSEAVTYSVVGSAVSVSGSTVTATASGVAKVAASSGTMSDTTHVTVPVRAMLAAFTSQGFAIFNTDGSGFRVLAPDATFSGLTSAWVPSGTEVAFDRSCCAGIRIANLTTGVRTVTPATSMAIYPEFSRDGEWLYYTREGWRLYRVHPDGTGDAPVPMSNPVSDGAPSPSPDGTRLVYVRITGGSQDQLWMLDLASGASTDLKVMGHTPAWSPTGNQIAFLALSEGSTIKVMNPDGTGIRTVTAPGNAYSFGLDWSPDGDWIVARNASRDRLELIHAASGEVIPLGYTRGYNGPSWKP